MAKQDLILLALNPSPILDLMERALRAAGYEVAVAHDQTGLNKSVQEAIPALMIVGEKFAEDDGFSVSRNLLGRFPTLPIILYADQDTSGLAKSALKIGLSGYLYPPLRMTDIIDEVQRSLARARELGDWLRREVKRTTSSLAEKAKISETERYKLEAIIGNIQDGVIVMDERHHVLLANRAVYEIFNLDGKDTYGKLIEEVISNADLKALITRSSEGPLKYHEINFDDGRVFNAQYTPIPKIGSAITMQDISYLKELDRLKSDFIHTVSHDLRSPLTAILGYTELIERTGPLNQNQQEFLHRLQGSIQHITTLVNDLLDLGRLEAGFDTRRELVQLENILKYSLDMFDAQVRKKNIKLDVTIAGDITALRANPIRIRQMMDNLVGNAIKYTPAEGSVHVKMSMQDHQIILKIEDTGPGIPPEEQSRVFEKFFRATNAPEQVEGSGLGLAIVKSIVESHQGRVWVESIVGKGSSFIVILPAQE
ncbi:MAG: response regulator [Anaerolineales bacterium]|nr:response regulator [Anaerolineales bacterium]MBK8824896.1 response regulator [Anaerolineales bacterium]